MSALLAVSPRLTEVDARTRAEWDDEPVPETVRWGALGAAFGRLIDALPGEEAADVARVVEHLMHADQKPRDVVATGFLEALAAVIAAGRAPLTEVTRVLRPCSRQYVVRWGSLDVEDDPLTGTCTCGAWS